MAGDLGTAHTGTGTAAVTAADHRSFMGTFPTGVAVITSLGGDGRPHGLTCTSLASVSLCPPTLLVCLGERSGTLEALRGHGAFAVNLLHAGGQDTAELFASPDGRRFLLTPWRPAPRSGAPWLTTAAFATADCEVSEIVPAGDHAVVFGRVQALDWRPDTPLLYGLRGFSAWPGPASQRGAS
ncbi:flavin reductase family protein [Spirillospora sp. NPDC047279]|uniref:flavin reductase family protein n=1 Tax=Spirillospora sp. NPDC047279 TaxID=3155478 RepID=UPI0033C844A4